LRVIGKRAYIPIEPVCLKISSDRPSCLSGVKTELNNHANGRPPILLTIAGFDPSCGAGVAADVKTFAAHNCYGVAAVTALTVQSSSGVTAVHSTSAPVLRAQLEALAEDMPIAAVKIGMLGTKANAVVVAEFLDKYKFVHVILDPVTKSTAGNAELIDAAGLKFLRDEFLSRASDVHGSERRGRNEAGRAKTDRAGRAGSGGDGRSSGKTDRRPM
jgi:hypothetical protein